MKRHCIPILFLAVFLQLDAQHYNNSRIKYFAALTDSIILDTLSLIPGSITLYDTNDKKIPDSLYTINFGKSILSFTQDLPDWDSTIKITYKVFPYNFTRTYFHKDYDKIVLGPEFKKPIVYNEEKKFNPFAEEKLQRSGNISRGISFGNNQDVIVNSNLNLQLSGKLNNDLNIVAAITDDNIPIQPDGYSQQIQEFDKVFINIFNGKINLTAGDFEINHNEGSFLKANKKGQGGIATIHSRLSEKKPMKYSTTISGAVAKGRFTRNKLDVLEGNQGPYKLVGANKELYIIIIAGSEKVYIDGRLLTRGENNDYIIDYNASEIIFTSKQPVTKDKRIIVEFEYSDRNYARFMVYNTHKLTTKKGKFWLNIYNEQDSKNQTLLQDLSRDDKELLASIGDDLSKAVILNVDSVGYNNEAIRYKREYNPLYNDSIYVYSTNQDSAIYKVGFSFVGENKGNYIQDKNAANGKVYKWIEPFEGIPQGAYEPVTLLITPKKQQLITFGYDFNINKGLKSFFELGVSNNDMNTFSKKNNSDNTGIALKTNVWKNIFMSDSGKTGLSTSLSYEFIDEKFRPVERFRNVEFERDWNIENTIQFEQEQLLSYMIDYRQKDLGEASYNLNYLARGNRYKAYKNKLYSDINKKGYRLLVNGSLMNSNSSINKTTFLRRSVVLSKTISKVTLGIKEEAENNQWKDKTSDSLMLNSFSFNAYETFAIIGDSLKNNIKINFSNRTDKLPENNHLENSTKSHNFNIAFQAKQKESLFKAGISYRKLMVLDSSLTNEEEVESVVGRIENNTKLFKGIISASTFYEVGSGMEPIREFSYLKVPQGQGVYTWNDYNGNNTPELNEFEIANFSDEANYIRVFVPSNRYEKVFINKFSQTLGFDPYRQWSKKQGLAKAISKFSDQFSYRISQKNKDISIFENFNPFFYLSGSSTIQNLNLSIRNTLFFNKRSQHFGAEYIYTYNQNKLLLTNGTDTKNNLENKFQLRYRLRKGLYLSGFIKVQNKKSESEFFASRNFSINSRNERIELKYQPSIKTQLHINYLSINKKSDSEEEKLNGSNLGAEFMASMALKSKLLMKANYIKLNYKGPQNSTLAYEMLEGLKTGNNFTWMVSLRKNLSNGLELNLNYEGRSSEESKIIHLGGIQVRANF